MDFNENLSPLPNQRVSSTMTSNERSSSKFETSLTEKIRQTINLSDKILKKQDKSKVSTPDLSKLSQENQELILHAFEIVKDEDSKDVMDTLDESRFMLRNSLEEFKREQEEYRKQLEEIKFFKNIGKARRKENAIPIALFLRRKRDIQGLADLCPDSGMNTNYQAYFEALLTSDENQQQHPSDKAAVIRYIRRRERRKRAEFNRKTNDLSANNLEKQTAELIERMDTMDIKLQNEKQRQNDLILSKMNEKKLKAQNIIETNEIIDQASEANLVRERVEQKHRDKIEARLSARREQNNRTPTNMIHVRSRANETEDENENLPLSNEQKEETQQSIELLTMNNDMDNKDKHERTPIYGVHDFNEQITNISI